MSDVLFNRRRAAYARANVIRIGFGKSAGDRKSGINEFATWDFVRSGRYEFVSGDLFGISAPRLFIADIIRIITFHLFIIDAPVD